MTKTSEPLDRYSVSGNDSHLADTVEHSDARAEQRGIFSRVNIVWDLDSSFGAESAVFTVCTIWSVNPFRVAMHQTPTSTVTSDSVDHFVLTHLVHSAVASLAGSIVASMPVVPCNQLSARSAAHERSTHQAPPRRSPTFHLFSPGPTATTRPMTSWPGVIGNCPSGPKCPCCREASYIVVSPSSLLSWSTPDLHTE